MSDLGRKYSAFGLGDDLADFPPEFLVAALRRRAEEMVQVSDRLELMLQHACESRAEGGQRESVGSKVAAIIKAREARGRLFPPSLFSDPAWDILLHLLRAEINHVRLSFTRLAEQANVPPTTANRWISIMVDKSIVIRRDDHLDARRAFIELHPVASAALRDLIASQDAPGAI
jgi:DNA-binding MarR family transcriptional regulator